MTSLRIISVRRARDKLPTLSIPAWLAFEIETISKVQANSKSSVIRQLLVEAIDAKRRMAS